ncbi:MAG: Type 1 glutamine amidotransferase-like domain-containing protein [Candidatus Marsarchaeota archaeon]|nr:Type 1 glutamine amidotransferase-like domain-containing protein [Candidatus Marsarchaeota archaeon]
MTKLLLTSKGLDTEEIRNRCAVLLRHSTPEARILFIPTAMECKQADEFRINHINECRRQLTQMGIKIGHIITFDSNSPPNGNEIKDIDAVYVCGGFAYYLLQRLRRVHFDKDIINLVRSGALYIGVSAGSILAGPDISIASLVDPNDFGLKNTVGLKLTHLIVNPHYTQEREADIRDFERNNRVSVTRITDSQAVLEIDGKAEIIKSGADESAETE